MVAGLEQRWHPKGRGSETDHRPSTCPISWPARAATSASNVAGQAESYSLLPPIRYEAMKHSIKRRMIDGVGLWFAPVTLIGATVCGWGVFARGSLWLLAVIPVILYLWPPLLARCVRWLWPSRTHGPQPFHSREYALWVLGFRIEALYWYFPAFEHVLRCFPGVYSAWLRLWGARVGSSVFWGNARILHRGRLHAGDRVVFGDSVTVSSHALVHRAGTGVWLLTKDVVIGRDVIVGAHSFLGPGANLPDESSVPFRSFERASIRIVLGGEA